jgi:hypothetical protein
LQGIFRSRPIADDFEQNAQDRRSVTIIQGLKRDAIAPGNLRRQNFVAQMLCSREIS